MWSFKHNLHQKQIILLSQHVFVAFYFYNLLDLLFSYYGHILQKYLTQY